MIRKLCGASKDDGWVDGIVCEKPVDFCENLAYNNSMSLIHGVGDFFALDIGTTAIRLVQLSGDAQHGWVLQKFAYVPVERKVLEDGSPAGVRRLGEMILGAMQQAGITTKNIAVGMPAVKTFTTIVKVDNQPESELLNTVKYQLDKYIPMPLDEATVDYVSLGVCPNDATKAEVLISSTAVDFAEARMEMIESFGYKYIFEINKRYLQLLIALS